MHDISLFPQGNLLEGKFVPATKPTGTLAFDEYLSKIQSGYWQDQVLAYRTTLTPEEKLLVKGKLHGVTPSGTFTYRSGGSLTMHSGFMSIDVDEKDNSLDQINRLKQYLKSDNYVYSYHLSAGGFGVVIYIQIDPTKHLDSFLAIQKHFEDEYKILIDRSCKDVNRFRYVSYDPDIYINKHSKTWKTYLKKEQIQPTRKYIYSGLDIDFILQQISQGKTDLTDSYSDWLNIGFALVSKYGEGGLDMFHLISQQSYKYDPAACQKQYETLMKGSRDGITINTLFWMCANAGITIKTPRTATIERQAKMRRKDPTSIGVREAMAEAKAILKEMDDIDGADVDEILKQVAELPLKELNEKSDNALADLKAFVNNHKPLFNEVTRNLEIDGQDITDRIFNSMYIKALDQVDSKLHKDRLMALLDSDNTPSFHPFAKFFKDNAHITTSGHFDRLWDSVTLTGGSSDELKMLTRKWMVSIIASMHGTYSLLILVLTGDQNNGKTKFFRGLLPKNLNTFYAESNLDGGKDSEILMTKKLIIMDDEFGGKSKQDAKRLKAMSSTQTFSIRRPFGRVSEDLLRIAVLCGTSNEDEIINDITGNRRIIPLNITCIDFEKYDKVDKNALFMELYREYLNDKEGWMLTKQDILLLNNNSKSNESSTMEAELIGIHYEPSLIEGDNSEYVLSSIILQRLEIEYKVKLSFIRLGTVLRAMGFQRKTVREGKATRKMYLVNNKKPFKLTDDQVVESKIYPHLRK